MSRVIIIPVEGPPFEADMSLSFPAAKLLVGNAWIEAVRVNDILAAYLEVHSSEVTLLVDEEGMLKNLPINWNASPFYCEDPKRGLIHGPAALVGQRFDEVEMGLDWTDLPAHITPDRVVHAGNVAYEFIAGYRKPQASRG